MKLSKMFAKEISKLNDYFKGMFKSIVAAVEEMLSIDKKNVLVNKLEQIITSFKNQVFPTKESLVAVIDAVIKLADYKQIQKVAWKQAIKGDDQLYFDNDNNFVYINDGVTHLI